MKSTLFELLETDVDEYDLSGYQHEWSLKYI